MKKNLIKSTVIATMAIATICLIPSTGASAKIRPSSTIDQILNKPKEKSITIPLLSGEKVTITVNANADADANIKDGTKTETSSGLLISSTSGKEVKINTNTATSTDIDKENGVSGSALAGVSISTPEKTVGVNVGGKFEDGKWISESKIIK
ncbi:hypothetical protein JW813_04840 [Clostridium botulinum]|uniref:hypothetical protein n=1 Tax=Clostridium botulinum TaxID=1491 RepID=UPI0013F13587|nr:hypothetical protein [Clostridium botulinum]NFG23869.1 hypothetical protein [Clostridium botulinum]NFO02980.1 hypothetical protein [Clostridium botulinum]NFR15423.1 hypothetical protein [Clostridium botulinum]NFR45089.1 hypothetical protein [Clostridium botulinum]NFS49398.1 hypothetical protein [Clostridium botulinum]